MYSKPNLSTPLRKRYDPNNSDDDNSIGHFNTMIQDQNNIYGSNDLEEDIILQAAVHVKHTRTQHSLANKKIKQASFSNDPANKVKHKDKVQTIIMDYCQNLNLPHLSEDQPGDAYYFPLCQSTALAYVMP